MKVFRSSIAKALVVLLALAAAIGASYYAANAAAINETNERQLICYDEKGKEIENCDLDLINEMSADPNESLYNAYENLMDYHFRYISVDNIKAGNLIDEETLANAESKFVRENNLSKLVDKMDGLQVKIADLKAKETLDEDETKKLEEYISELAEADKEYHSVIDPLLTAYKETLIRDQLADFEKIQATYRDDTYEHYTYVIYTVDGAVISNIEGDININTFASYSINDSYTLGYAIPLIGGYDVADTPNNVSEVHIAMNEDYYTLIGGKISMDYQIDEEAQQRMYDSLYYAIALCVGYAICSLYLMIVAGRKPNDDALYLQGIDHVYSDIYFLLIGSLWGFGIIGAEAAAKLYRDGALSYSYMVYVFGAIAVILGVVTLSYLTATAKHIKNHDFLKYSLIGSIIGGITNGIMDISGKYINVDQSVKKKFTKIVGLLAIVNVFVASILLGIGEGASNIDGVFTIGFVVVVVMTIGNFLVIRFLLLKYFEEMEIIHRGTKIIAGGNLDYKIPPVKDHTLATIAEDINCISSGLKESMNEQMSSERTKIELITNVSHDLKTPLTSIISYIDLLSKNSDEKEREHYLEILSLKSNQLKKLVEDLFEITKIQNGQISVELNDVCMDDLVSQTLAEYDEAFVKKNLNVRYTPLDEKTMVHADGNKMYRVMSNILGNVSKYALEGTRVYIDFSKNDEYLQVACKNIANYEMNFDVKEISQRFKRGDDARTSEGNGLGLAIADSFMKVQGGSIEVDKDGDLFKVYVNIPLANTAEY